MTNRDFTLFWIISLLSAIVRGFNIDTESPVVRAGVEGTMFGFDVSVHRVGSLSWMLVGAPKAQTAQYEVTQGGAVFRCLVDINSDDEDCEEIKFDDGGNEVRLNPFTNRYDPIEEKSFQWFGATVKSSGQDGLIVACAPRYTYFTEGFDKIEPVGNCFTTRADFSGSRNYSPCKRDEANVKWNALGRCQAGYSADITPTKDFLVIGSPGSYYWQGQLHQENLLSRSHSFTPERPQSDDYQYLGYSVALGHFTSDYRMDYVVGVPRGDDLKGMVHVYDADSPFHRSFATLRGEQLGSYFGHAVAATDLNKDGYDDIIVGAPYYSDRESANEKWEAGRVYVFYQDANYGFGEAIKLTGLYSGGRFGYDVAAIGDVNQDSYNDFAVGAPYDGIDGNGAVYIYHGGENRIRTQPSQVITPSDINQELSTFGASLAGGLDMDDNQYPDILVGAYGSDHAVLLRSRPVVTVVPEVTILPEFIDLDKKECARIDGVEVACFTLSVCFEYSGVNVPETIGLSFTSVLDMLKPHQKRVYFQNTMSSQETIEITVEDADNEWCGSSRVYLKNDVTDKYSPIAVEMTYKLLENSGPNELQPVLNQYSPNKIRKQAYIQNNCGPDRICVPDLQLGVDINADAIYIGDSENLQIAITLANAGEDSFETEVEIQLPKGFDYIRVEKLDDTEYTIGCVDIHSAEGMVVICDAGNPLQALHGVRFALSLSTIRMNETDRPIDIVITANSTNDEKSFTTADNVVLKSLPVKVLSIISFTGLSVPEQITFKPRAMDPEFTIGHEDDIGPEVKHLIELRNLGPSAIDGAKIRIDWPAYTPMGEHLLYLLDVELINGRACIIRGELNPENLKTNDEFVVKTNQTRREAIVRGQRHRRAVDSQKPSYTVDCRTARCVEIECNVDFLLNSDESAFVEVRSRLWKDTLVKSGHDQTGIVTNASVEVNSMPYRIQPDFFPLATQEIKSVAITVKPTPRTLPVPIWVIIVAIICGLLILALIIFVLWKTGFFKRKRVQDKDKYKEDAQNKTNDGMATQSSESEIVGKTEKGGPPPVAL